MRGQCRHTIWGEKGFSPNSLVARLQEELGHAGWDTVEEFYIWREIGLFPATFLDSLGAQGRLRDDERCYPKPSKENKSTHYTSALKPAERAGTGPALTSGASSPQPQRSPPLCSAPSPGQSAPAACAAGT